MFGVRASKTGHRYGMTRYARRILSYVVEQLGDLVARFTEKPQIGEGWINGGFLVCEPAIFDYLRDDSSSLEAHGLEQLAVDRQLAAYRHEGFWQCMDTLREKRWLEGRWQAGQAPWKVW